MDNQFECWNKKYLIDSPATGTLWICNTAFLPFFLNELLKEAETLWFSLSISPSQTRALFCQLASSLWIGYMSSPLLRDRPSQPKRRSTVRSNTSHITSQLLNISLKYFVIPQMTSSGPPTCKYVVVFALFAIIARWYDWNQNTILMRVFVYHGQNTKHMWRTQTCINWFYLATWGWCNSQIIKSTNCEHVSKQMLISISTRHGQTFILSSVCGHRTNSVKYSLSF